MFDKKCIKCTSKVKKDFDFCPFCGNNLNSKNDRDDYGMLGKNDQVKEFNPLEMNNTFFDSLIKNAMKELPSMMKTLEKQMNEQNNNKEAPRLPNNLNVQFFVNGKKVTPVKEERKITPVKFENKISKENQEKLASLPRETPTSSVRRISGKVIYEIPVPGVTNLEDILINRLENSIEIKAISNNKSNPKCH